MSPFPRSRLRGQEVPRGGTPFRDVLYDIADITAQQCAEGIQGVGGYMRMVFFSAVPSPLVLKWD